MGISKLDKNFEIVNRVERDDIVWYEITEPDFKVYGLYEPLLKENPPVYRRMPDEIAKAVNETVEALNKNTAGGRIRFITDSPYIAIRHSGHQNVFSHMPATGVYGFDLFETENGESKFRAAFVPPVAKSYEELLTYESIHYFDSSRARDLTLDFPLYGEIESLQIGLLKNAVIEKAPSYSNELPVVFYGSSITQGGCASRPGNSYQGFISRELDMSYINLGFSGNARGQMPYAEYIKGIKMAAFVYDYDWNAPDPQWLKDTHYPFYKVIRDAQPDLPIICVSRPDFNPNTPEREERFAVIKETVERAKADGDENIYLVDGNNNFGTHFRDCCTVDGIHPNDLGFYRMAENITPILRKLLKK